MKYRILAVFIIILSILCISVSASSYEFTLSLGAGFTTAQSGDNLDDIAQKLNMTTDELNSFFNKNGLLYLAVSEDTKTQIRLSAFTDNFSSAAIDIANLQEDQLTEFKNTVSGDRDNSFFVEGKNGRKFIAVKNTLQDSGGVYTVTQYVTVCAGKTFYLACYNEGTDTSSEVQSIFEGFELNAVNRAKNNNTILILIAVGITVFTAVAVIMLIGIIKTKRNVAREALNCENQKNS